MKSHDFDDCLRASDTPELNAKIVAELERQFPHALGVERAPNFDDRLGADYLIRMPYARTLTADVKVRARDYAAIGQPDILLEIWADVDKAKPGWALDETKLTDYVLFYWRDTGRTALFDAHALRAVFKANLPIWKRQYGSKVTGTGSRKPFRTEFLCMPDADLASAIYRHQRNARRAA